MLQWKQEEEKYDQRKREDMKNEEYSVRTMRNRKWREDKAEERDKSAWLAKEAKILDIICCGVCLEVPTATQCVYQCVQGHTLCGVCVDKKAVCGQCGGHSVARNRGVEGIADILTRR